MHLMVYACGKKEFAFRCDVNDDRYIRRMDDLTSVVCMISYLQANYSSICVTRAIFATYIYINMHGIHSNAILHSECIAHLAACVRSRLRTQVILL